MHCTLVLFLISCASAAVLYKPGEDIRTMSGCPREMSAQESDVEIKENIDTAIYRPELIQHEGFKSGRILETMRTGREDVLMTEKPEVTYVRPEKEYLTTSNCPLELKVEKPAPLVVPSPRPTIVPSAHPLVVPAPRPLVVPARYPDIYFQPKPEIYQQDHPEVVFQQKPDIYFEQARPLKIYEAGCPPAALVEEHPREMTC